jgi:hypothetical protein
MERKMKKILNIFLVLTFIIAVLYQPINVQASNEVSAELSKWSKSLKQSEEYKSYSSHMIDRNAFVLNEFKNEDGSTTKIAFFELKTDKVFEGKHVVNHLVFMESNSALDVLYVDYTDPETIKYNYITTGEVESISTGVTLSENSFDPLLDPFQEAAVQTSSTECKTWHCAPDGYRTSTPNTNVDGCSRVFGYSCAAVSALFSGGWALAITTTICIEGGIVACRPTSPDKYCVKYQWYPVCEM